jgi:hypothetical protein
MKELAAKINADLSRTLQNKAKSAIVGRTGNSEDE